MKYYMLVTEELLCITKLYDQSYMPYLMDFPVEIENFILNKENVETRGQLFSANTLDELHTILYNQIGFDELYKLGGNYGLESLVNKVIKR